MIPEVREERRDRNRRLLCMRVFFWSSGADRGPGSRRDMQTRAAQGDPAAAPPVAAWGSDHERILVDWGDKAMCFRWMHRRAHEKFQRANMWFTIPVIVLSTITGTANFAQERIGEDHRDLAVMVIGALNIFAGILTTIQQFLKITEVNEAHRVASIAWDKFHRNIRVCLCKSPAERPDPVTMLKMSKEEFDRLMETSPTMSKDVASEFVREFEGSDGYSAVALPEICGVLRSTREVVFDSRGPADAWRRTFLQLHGRNPLPEEEEAAEVARRQEA